MLVLIPTAAGIAPEPKFTGNPQGVALLAKINRAYQRVGAIGVVATSPHLKVAFTMRLTGGIVTSEQAIYTSGSSKAVLVGSLAGTYARDAGTSCWRFVRASDPQALADLGHPVVAGPGRVDKPVVRGSEAEIVIHQGQYRKALVVDLAKLRIRHGAFASPKGQGTLQFSEFASAPRLLATRPHC